MGHPDASLFTVSMLTLSLCNRGCHCDHGKKFGCQVRLKMKQREDSQCVFPLEAVHWRPPVRACWGVSGISACSVLCSEIGKIPGICLAHTEWYAL